MHGRERPFIWPSRCSRPVARCLCLLGLVLCPTVGALAGDHDYSAVFAVRGQAAVYEAGNKALKLFSPQGTSLSEGRSVAVPGQVWGVAAIPDGYVVATGMGRGDLNAPTRLTSFASDWNGARVVFERAGERSQLSFLRYTSGKLWATFFESKYETVTGTFTPGPAAQWDFSKILELRLGDAADVLGDAVLVGQPYGEPQGQDGGAILFTGAERIELPSYRGVRAVALLGEVANLRVLIADGWHQSYGQLAQGRLSYLKKDASSGRFALQLVDHDYSQFGFSKLIPFAVGSQQFVAALGNRSLCVYGPEDRWVKRTLYERQSDNRSFDVALLDVDDTGANFVLLDGELRMIRFSGVSFVPSDGR